MILIRPYIPDAGNLSTAFEQGPEPDSNDAVSQYQESETREQELKDTPM